MRNSYLNGITEGLTVIQPQIATRTKVSKGIARRSPVGSPKNGKAQQLRMTANTHRTSFFLGLLGAAEPRSGPVATRSCQPRDQDQNQTVEQKRGHKRRGIAETKILEQEFECPKCYG